MTSITGLSYGEQLMIGDMAVISHDPTPAKLLKAAAVISGVHEQYDREGWLIYPGKSKDSCVLCALTVRDFLLRIGFKDAAVRSVTAIVKARSQGKELHSLGVGQPGDRETEWGKWAGHLVTTTSGYLIDTTLAPWKRPAWPHLPEQLLLQYIEPNGHTPRIGGLLPVAATFWKADQRPEDPTYEGELIYFDRPDNRRWKAGGDAKRDRRKTAVAALVKRFGSWRE